MDDSSSTSSSIDLPPPSSQGKLPINFATCCELLHRYLFPGTPLPLHHPTLRYCFDATHNGAFQPKFASMIHLLEQCPFDAWSDEEHNAALLLLTTVRQRMAMHS